MMSGKYIVTNYDINDTDFPKMMQELHDCEVSRMFDDMKFMVSESETKRGFIHIQRLPKIEIVELADFYTFFFNETPHFCMEWDSMLFTEINDHNLSSFANKLNDIHQVTKWHFIYFICSNKVSIIHVNNGVELTGFFNGDRKFTAHISDKQYLDIRILLNMLLAFKGGKYNG